MKVEEVLLTLVPKEFVLPVSTMLALVVLEILLLKGRMPLRGESHGSKVTIGTLWFLMLLNQQAKVGSHYWPR